VLLQGEGLAFDLVLYGAAIVLGFLLPRLLWPLGERSGARWAARVLAALLAVLLAYFTFHPPAGILFADLSGGVRTFLTIPV
jgi:chromate transport protein ChrA